MKIKFGLVKTEQKDAEFISIRLIYNFRKFKELEFCIIMKFTVVSCLFIRDYG